jgi:outer membrane protein assembly factor BamB
MRIPDVVELLLAGFLGVAPFLYAGEPAKGVGSQDPASLRSYAGQSWPHRRGPNRDGVVVDGPKLLDSWPTNGPPLVWKSAWIPSFDEGGCGDPVVAGGKVFVYANARPPEGSPDGYQFITTEFLSDTGLLPDLPEDLAKKVGEAWESDKRPSNAGWEWSNTEEVRKDGALDAFLAKKPELDKYIKDFIATLPPEDAKKYGDCIKKRLCIPRKKGWGVAHCQSWDALTKISRMRDARYRTRFEWEMALSKIGIVELAWHYPKFHAWKRMLRRSDTVFCLDAATGKTLWQKDFACDPAVIPLDDGACALLGACGTPAVVGDRCFVSGAMGVYCLSVKDGALLWHTKGGFAHSALLVTDGVVYDNGRGCADSAENGALLWKNTLRSPPGRVREFDWNVPVLWSSGGKNYIIAHDGGHYFACLEPRTGQALWTVKVATGWFPALRGDLLIMPIPWPSLSNIRKEHFGTKAYKLTLTGPELLWQKGGFSDHDGDVIYQDYLYMIRQCVDLKTGEVNWKDKLPWSIAPPILADGKVFGLLEATGSQGGKNWPWSGFAPIVMFKATPEKYVELGKFEPGACPMSSPAFSDGKLFVRTVYGMACYDLRQHGVYLGGVAATKDTLTFTFEETGGGLTGAAGDVRIAPAGGAPVPAKAQIQGECVVVDVKDVPIPFVVSCVEKNALAGKNGKPVPAFEWNTARVLKFRGCAERTIMLTSDLPLLPEGRWNKAETYTVAAAKVTDAVIDPKLRKVTLTTDKTWRAGDALDLTYASFPVDKGEPRRETLKATVVEHLPATVKFVKTDTITLGNWKGVYGKDGAVIAGDAASAAPKYVTLSSPGEKGNLWAASPKDERYLLRSGEATDRTITQWTAGDALEFAVDTSDGQEHQVAAYYLETPSRTTAKVDVLDAETGAVLDSQPIENGSRNTYLIWRVKGRAVIRFVRLSGGEGSGLWVGGMFFD